MTVPDGLNECIVHSVVSLLFLKSLKAQLLQARVEKNMLCTCSHILFILKSKLGKKKKGHVSSLFIQLFIEKPEK